MRSFVVLCTLILVSAAHTEEKSPSTPTEKSPPKNRAKNKENHRKTLEGGPALKKDLEHETDEEVDFVKILQEAEEFELFSLNPVNEYKGYNERLHHFQVLGSTIIRNKETRKKLTAALEGGFEENNGQVAKCFDPRHAIRVRKKGKTVEMLICFTCAHCKVYIDGKESTRSYEKTSSTPMKVFNKVLAEHDVLLPARHKAEKE